MLKPRVCEDVEYLNSIKKLEEELFKDEAWSYDQLLKEFKNSFSKVLIIGSLDSYEVKGYLIARFLPPEAEILKIGIEKSHQNKGLGKLLMNCLFSLCKVYKIKEIFLELKKTNQVALKFYEKMGFKVYGERKRYYKEDDALLMKRLISD